MVSERVKLIPSEQVKPITDGNIELIGPGEDGLYALFIGGGGVRPLVMYKLTKMAVEHLSGMAENALTGICTCGLEDGCEICR